MLELKRRSAASVLPANAGGDVLFVDSADGLYKTKDSANTIKVLGNGITEITKTSGSGLPGQTDTYTILLDDGRTRQFQVTNGLNGAAYTDEEAQDAVATAFMLGVHDGVTLTYNDTLGSFTLSNTDKGSAALAGHLAASDPHPQYTTTAEASAAAPVQSVNGQTGAVIIPLMTVTTLNAPTASFSTAVTTVVSQAIAGGSIAAGSMFQFRLRAQVINTTATSNLVATISIGATNVLVATQALGATARAAPGQPVVIEGTISFSSATTADASVRVFASSAVAFDAAFGTSVSATVVTAANTTADIKLNTSAATSTVIVREALLVRIK